MFTALAPSSEAARGDEETEPERVIVTDEQIGKTIGF